jgi:phage shock protein A
MSHRDRQRQKLAEQRQQWQDATERIEAVIRQIGTTTDAEKLLTLERRLQELQAERDALEPALQALEAEPEEDSAQPQSTRSLQHIRNGEKITSSN